MSNILTSNIENIILVEHTFDPGSVATITTEEETVTVVGVKVGDFVAVSKPTLTAGVMVGSARVSADDTILVQFVNPTAGAVDAGSETYQFLIVRSSGARSSASF